MTMTPLRANLAETRPAVTPAGGRRRMRRRRVPWWFLLPGLVIFVVIAVIPTFIGVYFSFTDATTGLAGDFIGLENYFSIFSNETAFPALLRTVLLTLIVTILQNVIGLALALALNSQIKSRHFLRVLFFLPFVLAPLVTGYIWQLMLANDGAINSVLRAAGLGEVAQSWLSQPTTAFLAIVIAMVWQYTGSTMVIYLAGLQSVPHEVIEAAALDGASGFRMFWSVVRPFLAPAITVNFTLTVIGGLRVYDQVVALTGGGPAGTTETISTLIVKYAFTFGEFGYGSALAVLLTIFVLFAAGLQYLGLRKQAQA